MSRLALLVGVSNYKDEPLAWCVEDARAVRQILEGKEYGFTCCMLEDAQATTRNLKDGLKITLQGASELALFYFAGHGAATDDGAYLLTIDGEDRPDEGLDLAHLTRMISAYTPRTAAVVVILDCCQSGAATIGHGSARVALKGDDLSHYVALFSERRALLAACQENQLADEEDTLGHGVFTYYLLEGLLGNAADEQGVVTVTALYDSVSLAFAKRGGQSPVFRGDMNGRIELGSGLLSNAARREVDHLEDIERQAASHLGALQPYLSKVMADHATWKGGGFLTACKQVTPVAEWFENRSREHRQLANRPSFSSAKASLLAKCKPLQNLEPGLRIEGGVVEAQLGHGSFGSVWRVSGDHGSVAIKVYHSHDLGVDEKVRRFRQGFSAMRKLEHPQIVKVQRFNECPLSFTMDYIDGPNLRNWAGTTDDPTELLALMLTVADTLRHAHSRGVVHRDVKPENILVLHEVTSCSWKPHLTDFDLAWFSTSSLQTHDAIGTVFYAAPEQLAKPGSTAARSPAVDVYSFGQLMYYALTTSDPKPLDMADNVSALSQRVQEWGWSHPAELLVQLYADCTKKAPSARPAGMEEVTRRLSEVLVAIREGNIGRALSPQAFIHEVRFAVIGLAQGPDEVFLSLARQTRITLTIGENQQLTVGFVLNRSILVDGVPEYKKARQILNMRVAAILAGDHNVVRKSGKTNPYEVFLTFRNLPLTFEGVRVVRNLILKTVDVLEKG